MSKMFGLAAMATLVLVPSAAAAQSVTLEQLAQRVEALERENAVLKQEMARLRPTPAGSAVPPPAAAVAVAAAPAPPSHPIGSWTGPYLGVNAGVAESRYRGSPVVGSPRGRSSGVTWGAQLGWRWQSGSLVAGIELEASFPQGQDVTFFPANPVRYDTDVAGRAKGQIGIALGRVLLYGTAGVQVSAFNIDREPDAPPMNVTGLLFGGGLAARILPHMSAEIEATQTDLGTLPNTLVASRARSVVLRLNQNF